MNQFRNQQSQAPAAGPFDSVAPIRTPKSQLPKLQSVGWLAQTLGLSMGQTYEAIASKKVPGDCILRVGRRIRLIEERVVAWILRGDQASGTNYAS